jgi:hypothetical protein
MTMMMMMMADHGVCRWNFAEAGDYEKALKTLYLKTDEDLRAGGCAD